MKHRVPVPAVLGVLLFLVAGCEPPYTGPYAPEIAGKWTGIYYVREIGRTTRHLEESITATIYQDRTNHTKVAVLTSRTTTARLLRGTIDAKGFMRLVDSYDNEIWTTHYRNATNDFVEINDIIYREEPVEGVVRDWGDLMATIRITPRDRRIQENPFDRVFNEVDNPDRVLLR